MKFGSNSIEIQEAVKDFEHPMIDALPMWDVEPSVQPADAFISAIPNVRGGWRFRGNEIFPVDFP